METVLELGLDWIEAIQTIRTPLLDALFSAFTFLGNEEFYLLVAPVILWCIDFRLGARLGVLFLLSGVLNVVLKDALMQPRPCDFQPEICIDEAAGYGLPSGHAQNAIVFWGTLANWLSRGWAWAGAISLMFLIGLSRIYLGVHFPTDVLGGWTIGLLLLVSSIALATRIERRLASLGTVPQVLVAFALAALAIAADPSSNAVSGASAFAGFGAGLALTHRYVPFSAGGPLRQRAVRFSVGVVFIVVLFFGLRVVFPQEGEVLYVPFRILRYLMIGLWISFGAPWLFRILKLTSAEAALSSN